MVDAGVIVGPIMGVLGIILIIVLLAKGIKVVKEKEVMVIERFGEWHSVLTAGIHFVIPFVDRPKRHSERYFVTNATGITEIVQKQNMTVISTQNEVLDFPKQQVITRDNATVLLDAVLSYKVVNAKQMIYTCQNLPHVLSKLLQASLRNVAGSLELDQIIEDSASMNVLTGSLDQEASRWGVKIVFVKVQKVEAPALADVLAAKKNADLKNQEVIIKAKAFKQTKVIESEGLRDSNIRRAEGEAAAVVAQARGDAQAILNKARAEERSIKEIARAISKYGENPSSYLLSLKYIEALQSVMCLNNTEIKMFPDRSAFIQILQNLGLNSVIPSTIRAN